MPQVSTQEFERLPLRVHTFLAGVPLHDVWSVDLPRWRAGVTLDDFLRTGRNGKLIRVVVRNRRRYSRPRASMLPSIAQLTRAAEGVFIVEDVNNIGPNYDPTLLAWEENFRRAWPRFADRYGERFRRMWRFYLLSCAGAFRARSLQVFSILFSKEGNAIGNSVRDERQTASSTRTAVLEASALRV